MKNPLESALGTARTLIVGLGNPIRGDDGVGWRVAEQVRRDLPDTDDIEVETLATGGLRLMERLLGYERVVIIDAVLTGQMDVGSVRVLPLEAFAERCGGHVTSPHDTSLSVAVGLARSLGADVPDTITIVGIEASPDFTFSETLSPEIERAVPVASAVALATAGAEHKESRRDIA